jgi:hypothetical protein
MARVQPKGEQEASKAGAKARNDDQGGHGLRSLCNFTVFVKFAQRHAIRQKALKPEDVARSNPATRHPLLNALIGWVTVHLSGKGGWPAVMADQASDCGRVVCFHTCSVPQQKRVTQAKRVMTHRLVAAKVLA